MSREYTKVWDPLVRIFHWSLVIFFFTAYFSSEEGEGLHVFAGYAVLGLVLFRILWGFAGTEHARFRDFIYSPAHIVRYLKNLFGGKAEHYLGHNPAGGLMVLALLASLLLTTVTGLKAYGAEGHGPLAGAGPEIASMAYSEGDGLEHDGDKRHGGEDDLWEEVHEVFANLTLLLVGVHIAGAIAASYLHRENLILAMITGRKPLKGE